MSATAKRQAEYLALLEEHVVGLIINGAKATGHVPWRGDKNPSFSADLEKGVWYDQARQEGGGIKDFKARIGRTDAPKSERRISATYDYTDAAGELLFQVVRYTPKDFGQRKPDGHGGWVHKLGGVQRVLYRLPEISGAKTVYVPEGERDVDRLRSLGHL